MTLSRWLSAAGLLVAHVPGSVAATKPPVHWSIRSAPSKTIRPGAKFSVTINGSLDPGWHLYALEEPEGGPIATEIALTEGDAADLIRVEEGKPKLLPDPLFQKSTGFFEVSAEFTLHLQAFRESAARANGLRILVRYQSCNDRICLPPRTDTIAVPVTIAR